MKTEKPLVLCAVPLPEDDFASFPVLPKTGTLTQSGETKRYTLNDKALQHLVLSSGYGPNREIPIDFEHSLYYAAEQAKTDEAAYAQEHPGEKHAAGWVSLQNTAEGVVAILNSMSDRAKELIKEKAVKYISPVVRNFGGDMQISSLALTNTPAINELPPLVASALAEPPNPSQEVQMDLSKVIEALDLQGGDLVASGDETKQVESIVSAINSLKSERDTLLQEKQESKRNDIIASAQANGKLPESMLDWAKQQTVEALESWAQVAPRIVPTQEVVASQIVPAAPSMESQELSDEAVAIRESFEAIKKQKEAD